MNNPALKQIGTHAIRVLNDAYGHAAVADGDDIMIINAFDGDKIIEVKITVKNETQPDL